MQTLCALLLFAGAASTVAFTPHGGGRQRRGAGGASSGAFASASGGAGGHGHVVTGGTDSFVFPGHAAFGPASFQDVFRSYFDQMESLLAAQQAQAQALSNRFWTHWRNSIAEQAEAATLAQKAAAAAAHSPQYYQYYGSPQASHSHSAVSFYPHRFNAASANAIGNDNQEAAQGVYGVQSGDSGYGGSYGASYGNSYGNGYGAGYGTGYGGGGAGASGANSGGPAHGFSGGGVGGSLGGAAQGAQASLAVNDRGGFGQAQLYPDPELSSRIAGDIAPLSGGSFGVFSSSSSSSVSDPSGKTQTFKQATVGVNDNGKVTTFSVKDP